MRWTSMWVCVKQQIASNLEFLQNRDLQVVFKPENGSKCPRNAPEKSTGEGKVPTYFRMVTNM